MQLGIVDPPREDHTGAGWLLPVDDIEPRPPQRVWGAVGRLEPVDVERQTAERVESAHIGEGARKLLLDFDVRHPELATQGNV